MAQSTTIYPAPKCPTRLSSEFARCGCEPAIFRSSDVIDSYTHIFSMHAIPCARHVTYRNLVSLDKYYIRTLLLAKLPGSVYAVPHNLALVFITGTILISDTAKLQSSCRMRQKAKRSFGVDPCLSNDARKTVVILIRAHNLTQKEVLECLIHKGAETYENRISIRLSEPE